MATAAQLRKLALSMPEVEEKSHFGHPDFRVSGKIFAGLTADEKRATLKLTSEAQSFMLEIAPNVFSPCAGAWGRRGWTFVELARADLTMLQDLIGEAWRLTAPKRLIVTKPEASAKKAPSRKRTAKPATRAPRKKKARKVS